MVEGVKGAKYQKVNDEAEAQALLTGTRVVLKARSARLHRRERSGLANDCADSEIGLLKTASSI
jgi:hypothetical protein